MLWGWRWWREIVKAVDDFKPPFPYYGGKSAIAHIIWQALGDVKNYVEPFFGSGAVLFLRPHAPHIETINDADGMVANFWRALQRDPGGVAEWADWIVSEVDLHARHLWLIGQRDALTERLCADPDFYDTKAAGWWLWGICIWIGGGWCSGEGPWTVGETGLLVKGDAGKGIKRQLPHLGSAGQGECELRREWLLDYLSSFADRLRNVRVCCGDWSRVCGPSVTFQHGLTGVFLDPPYSVGAGRDPNLYAVDNLSVAHAARKWAIEMGERRDMRIILAGYEGEHEMPDNWQIHQWETNGGYANQGRGRGKENSKRERLWLSPHCPKLSRPKQINLF